MGHGFRFSLDKRYVLDKSQMHCDSEEPYPACWHVWDCNVWKRLWCVLWDICNLNIEFLDRERRSQKRITEYAKELVTCADCGKQMPKVSQTKDGALYLEYQGVHYIDGNTNAIYCKDCYRKQFPQSWSGNPCG